MRFFILILLTFLSFKSVAQDYDAEKFSASIQKDKQGSSILRFKGKTHSFSLNLFSKKVSTISPGYLKVDNKALQYLLVPIPQKVEFDGFDKEANRVKLLDYKDYEMDYLKQQLAVSTLKQSYEFISLSNRLFLFWTYDMPKSYPNVTKQCYLVTICFNNMVVLNSPVEKSTNVNSIKDFVLKIGGSLKSDNVSKL